MLGLAATIVATLVLIWSVNVTATVCYFGQELDPNQHGRLRWVMPGNQLAQCSYTGIRPGGVNTKPQKEPRGFMYTDNPLFTDDQKSIQDYFHCQDFITRMLSQQPSAPIDPTTGTQLHRIITSPNSTTVPPSVETGRPSAAVYQPSTTAELSGTVTQSQSIAAETDKPSTTTNLPSTLANVQTTTTDLPSTTNIPSTTTNLRSTTADLPSTTTDQLSTTTDQPSTTADLPSTTTNLPSTTTDIPSTTTDPTSTTTDQPITTTDQPSTTAGLRSTTNNLPSTTAGLPSTTLSTTTNLSSTTNSYLPADCQALFNAGNTHDGVYTIYPSQYPGGLEVYCDMAYWLPGWIIFQRRQDGSVNFTRHWTDYRDGFGSKTGEFWLGNEVLRRLTSEGDWELLVVMLIKLDGNTHTIHIGYSSFRIVGNNYTLELGMPWSGYLDALSSAHKGKPFSTYDQDNDDDDGANCADLLRGGWWFGRCTGGSPSGQVQSNLNGEYLLEGLDQGDGIRWAGINSSHIMQTEMKIRIMP